MTKPLTSCAAVTLVAALLAASGNAQQVPPPAPVRPVSEQLFGETITDPYRYMEDLHSPEVQAQMKAEADYARTMLDALPERGKLLEETFAAGKTASPQFRQFTRRGDQLFYLERLPGEPDFKLYVRSLNGQHERLVCDPAKYPQAGASHTVLLDFTPSNKANLVTVSLAGGGSETATIHVLDVANGKEHPDMIPRDRMHDVSWLPDDSGFVYSQLQEMRPGMKPAEMQVNSSVRLHKLGADSATDANIVTAAGLRYDPALFPSVNLLSDSHFAILTLYTGVSPTSTLFVAPMEQAINGNNSAWKKLAGPEDGIYEFDSKGDELFMVAGKDSPNFRVLRLSISNPNLKAAKVLVPEQPGMFIGGVRPGRGIAAASDALYIAYTQGGSARLGSIGYKTGSKLTFTGLPAGSALSSIRGNPRETGALITVDTWTAPPYAALVHAEEARTLAFTAGVKPAGLDLQVEEVEVPAKDGVQIPLTIIYNKGYARDGTRPLLMYGYGAYGISTSAGFQTSLVPWYLRGYGYAIPHVRGGGERGEQWHLAGFQNTKHNTWEDAIACAEYLIQRKYTSATRLGLFGASAGGILAGRALEERPDLFAAVIDAVPMTDVLELRRDPNGPDQKAEFGWFDTEAGFRSLMAMSSYHHVVPGQKYPAVLLYTGANDPRVSPAQPMKMAARLRAATSSGKPILLQVDYDAGHGPGTMTLKQEVASFVDFESFLLWQAGVSGFQPQSPSSTSK